MDGKMLLLPVYHVPGSSEYARYWSDTHGKPKPKERGYYYYSNYPQKWDRSGFCDKFSDKFRPGDYRYKWAQGLENGWVIPLIPFGKPIALVTLCIKGCSILKECYYLILRS